MLEHSNNEEFLTAEELAKELKVKISWVRWQSHKRTIPCHSIGKYKRYKLTEVLTAFRNGGD